MKYLTDEQKKEIVGSSYTYYDYTKETIEEIAHKNVKDLVYQDGAILVQALYPKNLICSGLFDRFLVFECHNGDREDPPKFFFHNLDNKELLDKIFAMFKREKIKPHSTWETLRSVVNKREDKR